MKRKRNNDNDSRPTGIVRFCRYNSREDSHYDMFVKPFGGARVILFDNGDDDSGYSIGGTCFAVKYRGKYFVLTAMHCLKNHRRHRDEIRISFTHESDECIPLINSYEPCGGDDRMSEMRDLMVYEVDTGRLDRKQIASLKSISLDYVPPTAELMQITSGELMVFGYPSQYSIIDYEKERIKYKGSPISANYDGLSENKESMRLIFKDHSSILSYDGLSGSPIIAYHASPKGCEYYFVGMMQRASDVKNKIGHFLSATGIIRALNLINMGKFI